MPRGRSRSEPRLFLEERKDRTPIWYIRWHDGQRACKRSTGTSSRREADKIFARWLVDYEKESERLPVSPRYPAEARISDVLAVYAKERGPELADAARVGQMIKRLLSWWQDRKVDAIRPIVCNAYRDARLEQGAQLGTVRKDWLLTGGRALGREERLFGLGPVCPVAGETAQQGSVADSQRGRASPMDRSPGT